MRRRWVTWLLALLWSLAGAGCITRTPAIDGRIGAQDRRAIDAAVAAIQWPQRVVTDDPWSDLPHANGWAVDRLGQYGNGYLYGVTEESRFRQYGSHTLAYFRSNAPTDIQAMQIQATITHYATGDVDGLSFKLYGNAVAAVMVPPTTPTPRGMVLMLGSIQSLSTPEQRLVNAFNESGWQVVYFTFPGTLFAGSGTLQFGVTEDELAAAFGSRIDNYLGESAYAAEAIAQYLSETRAELRDAPIVIIGASAGALAAPAAAARLRDRVAACILIGGASNVYSAVLDGRMRSGFVPDQMYTTEPMDDSGRLRVRTMNGDAAEFRTRVASRTQLDPAHTAVAILDKPVLLLLARDDDVVPIKYGLELYEGLHKPERWMYPCGHELMFFFLPRMVDRIVAWTDAATSTARSRPAHAGPTPAAGAPAESGVGR
ncbi:MAG: alpha/beta fold hydrolase [Phycisphaerales bacterium]